MRVCVAILFSFWVGRVADAQETAAVDPDHAAKRTQGVALFKTDVRKILKQKCVGCHGENSTEGKLDLATQEGLLKGGERGPAAVIGRGSKSLLSRVITHQQEPQMPKDGDKLSAAEIAAIIQWIDLGAPYDEPLVIRKVEATRWTERKISPDAKNLWSYQPLKRVVPPDCAVAGDHRIDGAIVPSTRLSGNGFLTRRVTRTKRSGNRHGSPGFLRCDWVAAAR